MDFSGYLSPFSWRYATPAMRTVWSEENKRKIWRKVWVTLAEVEAGYGLVSQTQISDLNAHQTQIDLKRALEIEAEIHHDLMAELKTFAEQCPLGGAILHLGATSMDIEDNADVLRICDSIDIILDKLKNLLILLTALIDSHAETVIIAYTHIQPAEPSTLGYRFALYAQDIFSDWKALFEFRKTIKGKGFKGAVGTGAGYADLLGAENLEEFEHQLSDRLGISFYSITSQTYPRKQDYFLLTLLASIAGSVSKMALDLRILQSPAFGELSEPFGKLQVGSSAMPFKRNPINSEKINSLARYLATLPQIAWDNSALTILERTLDDNANRRIILPEGFLCCDEILQTAVRVIHGLQINLGAITENFNRYAPFSAIERILLATSKAGADRQVMHEHLRNLVMEGWMEINNGRDNPLFNMVSSDPMILTYLSAGQIEILMDMSQYTGFAKEHSIRLSHEIRTTLGMQC